MKNGMSSAELKNPGTVYLVGAGPGDPGLLTLRGKQCLERADVVVSDYLANAVLLDFAPAGVEKVFVGKTRGCHPTPQEEINRLLVDFARQGKTVVRLKGGDPYLFGRGGEEAQALNAAGIPFEVVPGVTAASAAGAYSGIPLTHRDFTTSLALVTGHERPEKKLSSLDWAKLATGVGTLVFYMGMANLESIVANLLKHGRSPATPVAVVYWATTVRQQTLVATLATVLEQLQQTSIKPPAVIIVGEVVNLRDELNWFEKRPLFGKRILVTRTVEQSGELVRLLAEAGAEALVCPLIAMIPPADSAPLDAAIHQLAETDLLILTSVNAVQWFFRRLNELGLDCRALQGVELVAVGPKTASAFSAFGLTPDLAPDQYHAEGVIALLKERSVKGKRILYPHADLARDVIPQELSALGAEVTAPVAYRNICPAESGALLRQFLQQGIDAITLTSSSTLTNLLALAGDAAVSLAGIPLMSIGPQTSATIRNAGLDVAAEAEPSTLEGLVAAMVKYFSSETSEA
jgi:uroporphyrinogen III methyltransferase / synthase